MAKPLTREPDTMRVCNCAQCGAEMLGESEEPNRLALTEMWKRALPKPVYRRQCGRPYCKGCATHQRSARERTASSPGPLEDGSPWQDVAIRAMEGD